MGVNGRQRVQGGSTNLHIIIKRMANDYGIPKQLLGKLFYVQEGTA